MNMDNTLSRLISLGAKPPANMQVADEDLFTPRGPRLGFSGSLGTPPPLPITKKIAATIAAKEKENLKKKKKATAMTDDYDDEKGNGSGNDDDAFDDDDDEEAVEEGRIELLDMNVEEESLGDWDDSNIVSDEDDDGVEEDYSDIPAIIPLTKKASVPPPPPPRRRPVEKVPATSSTPLKKKEAVSDYESQMRRFLRDDDNDDTSEPIAPELVTWLGPCSEKQLHDHQVALTHLRAAATTGTTSAQNALTQLSTHSPQLGVGSEAYDKALKPYSAVVSYCDLDLFQDILEGNYQLNEEEGV